VKQWGRAVVVMLITLSLALVFFVDIDGNPLTQDFPDVVLVAAPAAEKSADHEDIDADQEADAQGRTARRVLKRHVARRMWTAVARRWHRSFLTDPPV